MIVIVLYPYAAYWSTWLRALLKPSQETTHFLLTHFSWLWWIVNNVGFIQDTVMRAVYFCKCDHWINCHGHRLMPMVSFLAYARACGEWNWKWTSYSWKWSPRILHIISALVCCFEPRVQVSTPRPLPPLFLPPPLLFKHLESMAAMRKSAPGP